MSDAANAIRTGGEIVGEVVGADQCVTPLQGLKAIAIKEGHTIYSA
jgi:hypothetical protein